jgi:hypothetical protein
MGFLILDSGIISCERLGNWKILLHVCVESRTIFEQRLEKYISGYGTTNYHYLTYLPQKINTNRYHVY